MKIIISPAKKINDYNDFSYDLSSINVHPKAIKLYDTLKNLSKEELKKVINASDAIVNKTFDNLHTYKLEEGYLNAIMAYDGIQYQYMAPSLFDDEELEYLNEHLLIINGLYGYNRPFDLIIPHRLEMQSIVNGMSLYDYWGSDMARYIGNEDIIDLASKEYSKAVLPHIKDKSRIYTISFKEEDHHKLIEKGVYVKMARGSMVRYMVTHNVKSIDELKKFNELNYKYNEEYSDDNHLVFTRKKA